MKPIDITGTRFGRLVAISLAPKRDGERCWICQCDCGKTADVKQVHLRIGATTSCGCATRELIGARTRKHGATVADKGQPTAEYEAWCNMRARCMNTSRHDFDRYGGRGIKVCDRWRTSFEAFLGDMGRRPSPKHSLDRIDVDGDYEPSNCRWADARTQARNKRTTRNVTIDGRTMCITDWCREYGIKQGVVANRIIYGWEPERAVTTPIIRRQKRG